MEHWIDKYKPKKLNDIVGNEKNIAQLKKHLKNYNNDNPNIIIDGPNGIGKSITVELLLEDFGFTKIIPSFTNIYKEQASNKKNDGVKEYYFALFHRKDINSMDSLRDGKIAIVIDDIETISGKNEKMAIKNFHKINMKYKLMPLIIISSNKHNKVINTLKKNSNIVYFNAISSLQLIKLTKSIAAIENIKLTNTDEEQDIYDEIINYSQGDVRCLINLLEQLKYVFEDTDITPELFINFCETSQRKDMDISIYDATKCLISRYTNVNDATNLYEIEKVIIPLMLHQNYITHIEKQLPHITPLEKITLMNEISKCLSNGDIIEGFIYSNQTWDLQNIHSFYTCALTSFLLNNFESKLNQPERLDFTKDMNKASIQKINTKNIFKTQKNYYMKNISVSDFLYINKIIKFLLDNKRYEEIAELLKPYNLDIDQIDSLLKIDKLKTSKSNLSAKQKKKIQQYMD